MMGSFGRLGDIIDKQGDVNHGTCAVEYLVVGVVSRPLLRSHAA